ncbi:MAG: hypothetical protein M0Q45_08485 [Bacteroidales bacterium]|nr:hypothetical protein [Bacteroidales bacterium]
MKFLLLNFCLLIAFAGIAQNKLQIETGVGFVILEGVNGIGGSSEILYPLHKNFSFRLATGYAMSSDKQISLLEACSYDHHSVFIGDIGLRFNPKLFNKVALALNAGGGIRHLQSTQVLVNSNLIVNPTSKADTGIGFHLGVGLNYFVSSEIHLGLQYSHDFFHEGHDLFCFKVGFTLFE